MFNKKVVIVGGGSAGLAAAIRLKELGVDDILVLEKNPFFGGILCQCIHTGFGIHEYGDELTGTEFAYKIVSKAKELNIEMYVSSNVLSISDDKIVRFSNPKLGIQEVKAEAILLSTGCYERNAGSIQLPGDRPSGICTAGQAQQYVNKFGFMVGKKVFILGSGDIGLIMARRMTLEGAKVLGVAEINPYSAGLNRNIVQCLNDFNIPLYLSHTVTKVIGKDHLEKIVISEIDENKKVIAGTEKEFACDALLLSVGLVPNVDCVLNSKIEFSNIKGAIVDQNMQTSIPGIFTAGNVLHVHDIVDNVCDEAREAANGIFKFLNNKIVDDKSIYDVKNGFGISYVIPQKLSLDNVENNLEFKFRVEKPFKNINIVIKEGEKILKRIYKPALIPSEMQIITLSKDLFSKSSNTIEISLEDK